jgi:hypothetical protein
MRISTASIDSAASDLHSPQFVSAAAWLLGVVLVAALVVGAAVERGLSVGVKAPAALLVAAFLAAVALFHVRCRRSGDRRLALALGALFSIFVAGAAGGVISIVGQMFALPLVDAPLAAADAALGIDVVAMVGSVARVPHLPLFLGIVYLSSIPLVIVSALALAMRGRAERVWELCAAFSFCMVVATLCSVLMPAVGPFEFLAMPADYRAQLPDGSGVYHLKALHELRGATQFTLDPFKLQGLVTFPSFHAAMAVMTMAAWRDDRRMRWPMVAWNGLVLVSTIPIGGHYLVDIPAGIAVWLVIFTLGPRWATALQALLSPVRSELEPA